MNRLSERLSLSMFVACCILGMLLSACSSDSVDEDGSDSDTADLDGDLTDLPDEADVLPDGDTAEDVADTEADDLSDSGDVTDSGEATCGDGTQPCVCFPPENPATGSNPSCGELSDFTDFTNVRPRTECFDANPGEAVFEMGIGENQFVSRNSEGTTEAELVRGGQGGVHIYASLLFPGLTPAAGEVPKVRASYWITYCAACGDGYVDGNSEECELGERGCSDTCEDTCGNGIVETQFGEECDDGGQTATCDRDCTFALCGDGRRNLDAGETCEPTPSNAQFCMPSCISRAPGASSACGDGFVYAPFEECDDGNLSAMDRCAGCKRTSCGDGIVQSEIETCDDGADNGAPGRCNLTCDGTVSQDCGDGLSGAGKSCDDQGESASCNPDCSAAVCGDGYVNAMAGETCDDGDQNGQPNFCNVDCDGMTAPVCGNGVLEDGENCEDNIAYRRCDENGENCVSNINYPACNDECRIAICGDGVVEGDEECDVGELSAVCDTDCTTVVCGDGVVNGRAGESCDDGENNGEAGFCNSSCSGQVASVCGNGVQECGEGCDSDDASCSDMCLPTTCNEQSLSSVASDWQDLRLTEDGWVITGSTVIFANTNFDQVLCTRGTLHVLAQLDDCTYYRDSFSVRPIAR